MKKVLMMPVVAAVVFAACAGDSTTAIDTTAKVRFFNGTWNAPDGIGFTANAQFVAGSALKYLQSTPTCSTLNAGNTSFTMALANPNGSGLTSEALALLTNQTITAGGNYSVLAGGNAIHPSVIMLDNSFSGTLGANQAAVRFVNFAASVAGPVDVFKGTTASGSPVQANLDFRQATPFSIVTSGANPYTITYNGNTEPIVTGTNATLNLQAGTVNTIVISRLNPPDGAFTLVNIPSCS